MKIIKVRVWLPEAKKKYTRNARTCSSTSTKYNTITAFSTSSAFDLAMAKL
jgi:hypothetical protein